MGHPQFLFRILAYYFCIMLLGFVATIVIRSRERARRLKSWRMNKPGLGPINDA